MVKIMSQASDNIAAPAASDKADTAMSAAMAQAATKAPAKGKPAPRKATPPEPVTQTQRPVVTFETAARECPSEGVMRKIVRMYGLDGVEYETVRDATNMQLQATAAVLIDNFPQESEKAVEMHMQRVVDAFVRSAKGAGDFYQAKAKIARDASSKIANEDRDEDRQGVDGGVNRAGRACEFAAKTGLQAYALLAMAHGAVDAYAHVTGSDWKPYAGSTSTAAVARHVVQARAAAFDE